ncbi:alternative splicing regulator domain-containing protein [Phthorimaea operculella]|nr:alternative splicing regulator domain-containing protein [Phthorimaea operculella]
MWHEARKQERMIRGMIVDYRRRAERRKDFYEKIKAEPTQFLQLHGRPCKIHLDPAVAAAGEGPAIMMPWQGDTNNMIDRFDVRAHLDFIPEVKFPDIPPDELSPEERQCNYERYRILAQNAFLGISEDKFLQQLAIEEQFGVTIEEKEAQKEKLNEKKGTGVAIGYNYNDPGAQPSSSNGPELKKVEPKESKDSDDDSDLEIIDVDLSIDVNKMEASQAHELNAVGPQFGMAGVDLFSFLTGDADDAEHQKQLLREEKEKAMFSGRKSRRERRAHRLGPQLGMAGVDLFSFLTGDADDAEHQKQLLREEKEKAMFSGRKSRRERRAHRVSPEPENIEFITSFGGEDEAKPSSPPKTSYADKVKQNLKKMELYSEVARKPRATRSSSSDRPPRPVMGPRWQSRSRKSAVPRYYGRRAEDKSSSELSVDSDSSDAPPPPNISGNHKAAVGNKPNSYQNQLRLSGSSSKVTPASTMSMMTTRSMHAEKTMAKLQQRLTEAEQINEKLLVERDEIDLEMKQLKSKNTQLTDSVTTLRTQCAESQLEIDQHIQHIDSLERARFDLINDLHSARDRCKFLNQQLNEANKQLADLHQEKEDIENKFSVSLHHELEVQDISTVRHTILTKGNKIKKYLRLNKFIKKTRHNLKLLRLTVKQQPNRIKRINLLKHTDEYKLLIRKMQEEFHQAEIKIKQMTMQITASESLHTSSELYIDHLQTQLANVETKYAESRLAHEQLSCNFGATTTTATECRVTGPADGR